jgi:hypothetical protein
MDIDDIYGAGTQGRLPVGILQIERRQWQR